jgi:hypothetical protein
VRNTNQQISFLGGGVWKWLRHEAKFPEIWTPGFSLENDDSRVWERGFARFPKLRVADFNLLNICYGEKSKTIDFSKFEGAFRYKML